MARVRTTDKSGRPVYQDTKTGRTWPATPEGCGKGKGKRDPRRRKDPKAGVVKVPRKYVRHVSLLFLSTGSV